MPRWIECNPGRAGIRHHDAGGAEDRQAADDAEPAVERLGGQPLAVLDRDLDLDVAGSPAPPRRTSAMASRIIRRGTGLMAGSPGGIGEARAGDGADAGSGPEGDAAAGRRRPHRREHQCAVGDVRIVAGVLDDAGGGANRRPCG